MYILIKVNTSSVGDSAMDLDLASISPTRKAHVEVFGDLCHRSRGHTEDKFIKEIVLFFWCNCRILPGKLSTTS